MESMFFKSIFRVQIWVGGGGEGRGVWMVIMATRQIDYRQRKQAKQKKNLLLKPTFLPNKIQICQWFRRRWSSKVLVKQVYEEMPHYENIPIQIYWKFYHQKMKNFRYKILIFFIFLLKT